jgi:hypothetical protein
VVPHKNLECRRALRLYVIVGREILFIGHYLFRLYGWNFSDIIRKKRIYTHIVRHMDLDFKTRKIHQEEKKKGTGQKRKSIKLPYRTIQQINNEPRVNHGEYQSRTNLPTPGTLLVNIERRLGAVGWSRETNSSSSYQISDTSIVHGINVVPDSKYTYISFVAGSCVSRDNRHF